MIKRVLITAGIASLLTACGGGGNTANVTTTPSTTSTPTSTTVTIAGKITYDRVPDKSTGLDYANTTQQPTRGAKVELLNSSDTVLATTKTDSTGNYSFANIAKNTNVKVRVKAELSDYGLTVVDNTNSEALYVLDGELVSSGEINTTRNLNATSGWTGTAYSSDADRKAAPFAILDSMYQSIQKVLGADSSATFDPLKVNWSVNNVPTDGNNALGQIGTSNYDGTALYILGKENTDTDEFDDHVMIHEWGHYFEEKFSRSDAMGGKHEDGDILDMRIAFGEAWGNALSGMVTDDPLYIDTSGDKQASGSEDDLETRPSSPNNPGFYSEASLQRVLYDLYDSTNEVAEDKTALGFTPIYNVMVNGEKNAPAFTSIFTFITALKQAQPADVSNIDSVVQMENMVAISDVYGSSQTDNRGGSANVLPIYRELTIGTTVGTAGDICADGSLSSSYKDNRLSVRRYFRFEVTTAGLHMIRINDNIAGQSSVERNLMRFNVAKENPFTQKVLVPQSLSGGTTAGQAVLQPGKYVMEVFLYNSAPLATGDKKHCFTVTAYKL